MPRYEEVQDQKQHDTANVDDSNSIREASEPYTKPKKEELPQVEYALNDLLWTEFEEHAPTDYPAQHFPSKDSFPRAFDKEFNTVLFSSCEDYESWVAEAADVLLKQQLLKKKVCTYTQCVHAWSLLKITLTHHLHTFMCAN